MIENVPSYVSIVFFLTTMVTVVTLLYVVKRGAFSLFQTKAISFLLPFGLLFYGTLAAFGFYLDETGFPPRLIVFGVLPSLIVMIAAIITGQNGFISRLKLRPLTWIHTIRIPVEIVLWWLYGAKLIPQVMTFEGRNFDILAGITAPIMAWFAFRSGKINRTLLIIWNSLALLLVLNIVVHAALSLESSFQQMSFDQPNRAVLYLPYIWLPTIIVPIVFFCHFASLIKLARVGENIR